MRRDEVEVPTEEDLNKIVDIILEETDTIWLFDQKGVAVSVESEEAALIKYVFFCLVSYSSSCHEKAIKAL